MPILGPPLKFLLFGVHTIDMLHIVVHELCKCAKLIHSFIHAFAIHFLESCIANTYVCNRVYLSHSWIVNII